MEADPYLASLAFAYSGIRTPLWTDQTLPAILLCCLVYSSSGSEDSLFLVRVRGFFV